jgi:hypothetical protein
MMGVRGELFSSRVLLPNRTYFFNVKENRMGDIYLNIVESKNRDTGGFDRQSIVLFADDLQEFLKGFDETLRVMEKEVREKRRSGGKIPKHEEKTYERQSGDKPDKSRRLDHERKPRPEHGENHRPDHGRKPRPEFGDNRKPDYGRKPRPEFGDNRKPDYGRKPRPEFGDSHRPDHGRKPRPEFGDNRRPGYGRKQKPEYGNYKPDHKPGIHGKPGQKHEKGKRIVVKKKRDEEFEN